MFILRFTLVVWLSLVAVIPTFAADVSGSWSKLSASRGEGAEVCNTSGKYYSCFALRCHPVVGLEFAFFFNVGKYDEDPTAKVFVDGKEYWALAMDTVEQGSELALKYSGNVHGDLITALQTGSEFVFDPGFRHTFRLTGSSNAIEAVLRQCPSESAPKASVASTNVTIHNDTDVPGHDYDMGTKNPQLRDVSWQQCMDICLADDRCAAFTHNGQHKICFLKDRVGSFDTVRQATSGIVTSRAPSATTNPLATSKAAIVAGLHWRQGADDEGSYLARLRKASVSFGGDCEVEKADMQKVAESLAISPGSPQEGTDRRFGLTWTNRALTQHAPLYLVVGTKQPIRLIGNQVVALAPGALAPFGIEFGREKTRGFVPLHASENLTGGTFDILPLEAGPLSLTVAVVGYLRSCQEEVVLKTSVIDQHIDPADPVITLRNAAGSDALPWRIELPEMDRLLRFDEKRYVLSDMKLNEIMTGDGNDAALSPTRRFISVRSNEGFDIIDPMDGRAVLSMAGRDLAWLNKDSFVITEFGPWARIAVGEPLAERVLLADQATACASCMAIEEATVDVNLESNFVIAAGGLGFGLVSLTDPERAVDEQNLITLDKGLKGSRPTYEKFVAGIGALAPFSLDWGFNAPLGLTFTQSSEFIVGKVPTTESRDYVVKAAATSERTVPASLRTMADALGEVGMPLMATDVLSDTIRPFPIKYGEPGYDAALIKYQTDQAKIRDRIGADVSAAGSKIEWFLPSGDMMQDLYCNHFEVDERRLRLAGDVNNAFRFDLGDRVVWAFRALCEGGPTYGTITWSSYFAVLDTGAIPATGKEIVVDDFHTFGNRGEAQVHERDFEIRLFGGRYVALFVPGAGKLKVFDAKKRHMLLEIDRTPRGDLLQDVHLDATGKFLVLENADGTLGIYRLADKTLVLEGKFIDGELLIWTPQYFFDGTTEGTEFVQLRFPGRDGEFSFQQFDAALRVPGLLQLVIEGTFAPPELVIVPPPELSADVTLAGSDIRIRATVLGDTSAVAALVYQDGQLTDTLDLTNGALDMPVSKVPGTRWVTVVGRDQGGLMSAPISVDIGPSGDEKPVVRYVGVGVDYYADQALESLNFAKQDVISLQLAFSEIDGKSIVIQSRGEDLLTDRTASKEAILAAAAKLAGQTQLGETAVFLFSGHGLRGADGRFYMGLSNTDTSRIEETSLAWEDLVGVLASSKGRVLVLLDACHSSAAGSGVFATNDEAAAGLSNAIPSGLVVLSASKGRETSGESFDLGGGFFTHAVVSAISGDRAAVDLNGNGSVEVSEFYGFVRNDVVTRREGRQTPWMSRSQLIGDFALF